MAEVDRWADVLDEKMRAVWPTASSTCWRIRGTCRWIGISRTSNRKFSPISPTAPATHGNTWELFAATTPLRRAAQTWNRNAPTAG